MRPLRRAAAVAAVAAAAAAVVTAGPAHAGTIHRSATVAFGDPTQAASPAADATAPAASKPATGKTRPEFSLTLSPAKSEVSAAQLAHPQTYTLYNTGSAAQHIVVTATSFLQNRDGSYAFTRGDALINQAVSVFPSEFTVKPGEHQAVQVKVGIRSGGEHMVGLLFTAPGQASPGHAAVNRSIGAQILAAAPGPAAHGAQVSKTNIVKLAPGTSQFFGQPASLFGGAIPMTATVKNLGTVHRTYAGDGALHVAITGWGASADNRQIRFPDFTVLRDSTVEVSSTWSNPPLVCFCRSTVTADDGQGHLTTASSRILVFPIVPSGGVVALAVGLWMVRRNRRATEEGGFSI